MASSLKEYLFAQEIDSDELISLKLNEYKDKIMDIFNEHTDGVDADGV